jgi:hypothetical protein
MSFVETSALKNSTIMLLYSEKGRVQMNPDYQRSGGVWTKEKKQLLIDSILNDYDIPKIYFHKFGAGENSDFDYSVIDGRQRLETIWGFMDGDFTLADDFEYQRDSSINLAGLSYNDLAAGYPRIRIKFDSFVLPIVAVETSDLDLIEDMFSRLNEAVPLNAAEKRNAIGGYMVEAIREVADLDFFADKVAFGNRRAQHREVAARLLHIENSLEEAGRIIDTKKVYIDNMARKYRDQGLDHVGSIKQKVSNVCEWLSNIFESRDPLLRAQGNIVIYYLVGRSAIRTNNDNFSREALLRFRDRLAANRTIAENDYTGASYELLEYDRLSQQGTNDAANIVERARVLADSLDIELILEA